MDEKVKGWNVVEKSKDGQEYIVSTTLKEGPRSKTIAVFFRNKHEKSGKYIVSLKISHNIKFVDGRLQEKTDKTITLVDEQIDALIKYIEKHYSALSVGEDSYISLDDESSISKVLKQIAELGLSEKDLVEKLYNSGILNQNLRIAIIAADRQNAIREFEEALQANKSEAFWQEWFSKNKWILGSEYIKILQERDIDEHHIADYIMQSVDGYLDLVEIKKPSLQFWSSLDSHGNYIPTRDLASAIMQCLNYLYRIERKSDSDDFRQRMNGVRVVKPKCTLVYGRSNDWDERENESFRILNSAYNQLNIITFDQLLLRAKMLLGIDDTPVYEADSDDMPF